MPGRVDRLSEQEKTVSSAQAEPGSKSAGGLSRGTNQNAGRLYNERLVLSLIRRHGQLPKADLARMTGLSPQTISIIANQLEADGLLRRGDARRGRVGQPSVPYSLNPGGAYAFGLKIGRRSMDLYLIDFIGRVVGCLRQVHAYPTPQAARSFAAAGIAQLQRSLPERAIARIAGLGIAAPSDLWAWAEEAGAPPADIAAWKTVDIRAELAGIGPWPVYVSNDITAACAAELMFGRGAEHIDYLYVFIGSFIGGGLVLDGHLFPGRNGNAGALGAMPAGGRQLTQVASIQVLERKLAAEGRNPDFLWQSPDWAEALGPAFDDWIAAAAQSLAPAIVAAVAVVDVETVVIDGAFPARVRRAITARTRAALEATDRRGLSPFALVEGALGSGARAMGGAAVPLLANFTQDREVLFKDHG